MWLGVVEGPEDPGAIRSGPTPRSSDAHTRETVHSTRSRPPSSRPTADRLASLRPDDTLVVSVEDAMASIPFAALPFEGGLLVEKVRIVTTIGLGMLASAVDRPPAPLNSFLLIGGPQRPELDPLEGSAREVEMIAELLGGSATPLSGRAATVGALKEQAPEHAVLHISCHAVADPAAERGSRLMLSQEPVCNDSGVLTEQRILSELELRQGGLVNLAGCVTGRLAESDAPLLGGLVPAFLLSGARSVIASHWRIADEPAARLQQEFYRCLAAGQGPAGALATTQRSCIRGGLGAEMRDPEVWGAYAAYGASA